MSDRNVNGDSQKPVATVSRAGGSRAGARDNSAGESPVFTWFVRIYVGLMVAVAVTVVGTAGWSAHYVSKYGFLPFDTAGMIDDIAYGDRESARAAATDIAGQVHQARKTVPLLAEIVADPESPNRDIAAAALGEIGPSAYRAVPELIVALESGGDGLQRAAIEALAGIGESAESAALPLAGILENGDMEQRELAAHALARIGYAAAGAEAALNAALEDSSPRVRAYALLALVNSQADLPDGAPALLTAMLADRDEEIRVSAAWALGSLDEAAPTAIRDLISALDDDIADVRQQAAWALGRIGEPAAESVPALAEAIDDPDSGVRASAVWAIGQMGDAAVPVAAMLIEALDDPDPEVQREAYDALKTVARATSREMPEVTAALDDHPLHGEACGHHGYSGKKEKNKGEDGSAGYDDAILEGSG
ncbi:MAG: HEAT repeat domain-containing protein [Alphaproteobacteria bacterium]